MLGTLFLPFFYFTPCAVFDDQPDSLHIVPKIVVRLCDLFVCSSEWMILVSFFVRYTFSLVPRNFAVVWIVADEILPFLALFAVVLLFRCCFSPRSAGLSSISVYWLCVHQWFLVSRFPVLPALLNIILGACGFALASDFRFKREIGSIVLRLLRCEWCCC